MIQLNMVFVHGYVSLLEGICHVQNFADILGMIIRSIDKWNHVMASYPSCKIGTYISISMHTPNTCSYSKLHATGTKRTANVGG